MPSTTQRSAAAFATHQQDENEESQASKSIPFHPQPQLIRPTSLADRLATEPTHIYTPVGTPLPPPADDEAPSEPTKPPPPKTNSGTMSYNASPRGEIIDLTGHDSEANGSQSPQLPSTSTSLTAQTTVEAVDEPPQRDNLHPRTRKISGKTILRTSLQHAPEMRDRRIGHNATRWIPIDRVHAEKEKQSSSGSSDRKSSYSSSQASSSKSANPSTSSLDTLASRVRNTGLTSQGSSKLSLQSQNFTFGQSAQPYVAFPKNEVTPNDLLLDRVKSTGTEVEANDGFRHPSLIDR
ncbi:hypothetical protein FA15DRAFT_140754 [Coprinopsis marcescibilis]|uniref:Uncharacterized protein n=1 Tax=Coprinopsis marcescibilis TaxID=230819 RepID=A0A5C3KJW8_COPMA|nr:hypothetical protein FA15DRAFT_140754 [Coprinopsis marcescibilis]